MCIPCLHCLFSVTVLEYDLMCVQELEDALLVDFDPDPSSLLVEIYAIFLTGILGKPVS